jgi:hypothetical protein
MSSFANDNGSFNENARENFGAFANDDASVVAGLDRWVAGPVVESGNDFGVEFEGFPRVSDLESVIFGWYDP